MCKMGFFLLNPFVGRIVEENGVRKGGQAERESERDFDVVVVVVFGGWGRTETEREVTG